MKINPAVNGTSDDDGARWAQIAILQAEATRQCVDIMMCIGDDCQRIGRICPEEDAAEDAVNWGADEPSPDEDPAPDTAPVSRLLPNLPNRRRIADTE